MISNKNRKVAKDAVDACEIIELTIGDLETLTRAFHVIRDVCEERSGFEVARAFDAQEIISH